MSSNDHNLPANTPTSLPMRTTLLFLTSISGLLASAQSDPCITNWMINTTSIQGRHYVAGNSTPIQDNALANVQQVQYSDEWVYVHTNGIPAYITGPFLDGNPSLATSQNAIFRFPRVPVDNSGTPTPTNGGNIGNFINGVAMFDYRDGVAWNPNTNALCGGPGNPPCPGGPGGAQDWNRDAIPAERAGFDCAKGHPAMGNYHHHQNPSAFNLDLVVISNVCDLYLADGLYTIDSTQHSPLLGFAHDGFPVYGAYGFANADGTGGVVRIRSGYQLRNITERSTHADGTVVSAGAPINTTYPLGYFREDYEFLTHAEPFYLDEHNGRMCVTPEYPDGTYAYFCTVDANWNSAYPYMVGPTFYGTVVAGEVNMITEDVSTYDPSNAVTEEAVLSKGVGVYPNPTGDLIAVQISGLLRENAGVRLFDMQGKLVRTETIPQGSTIWYLDTRTLYDGTYTVEVTSGNERWRKPVVVAH